MKKICKIVTCGDVDSGKSTLLGRLLYNTDNIYEDQLADIEKASKKYSVHNRLEYGLLFDGLLEERKQQITIDIAHRFFNIGDVRFHLLDCPGHVQYTHNFVIAASEADIAVLVIDATKGLMPQTLVHLDICKLFNISKIILAITKVDLVDNAIVKNLEKDIKEKITDVKYKIFKTSAIENINIDEFGEYIYKTSSKIKDTSSKFALCVQGVKKVGDERLYQGISFGNSEVSKVRVYPSKISCTIKKCENQVDIYTLDKNVDISRGFIITNVKLKSSNSIMGQFINFEKSIASSDLLFKYGTGVYKIKKLDNDVIELFEPIDFCNISDFKDLGYGLVIDNKTKLNVGVFVIQNNTSKNKNHCYWFTGYSGSGKTTLATYLSQHFPIKPILLDGDEVRSTINYDLTLSNEDRDKNVKKIANLAKLFIDQGFNVVVACISKDLRQKQYAREVLKNAYVEVFIEASEETRKKRDTKGLYKNNIKPLANYEESPWEYITINTDNNSVEQSFVELMEKLKEKNYI